MKAKKKIIKLHFKILMISLGLTIALLSLEAFFSVGSYLTQHIYRTRDRAAFFQKQTKKILCFGDSFTYGIGAEVQFSYPAQMQEILNAENQGVEYQVINLGVPGSNSTQVLKNLKLSCARFKPEAVVVLCGGNDIWNFDECNVRLNRRLVRSIAARLKTAKFFYVFAQNIKSRIARIRSSPKDNNAARLRLAETHSSLELIRLANTYRNFGYYGWAKLFYYKARKNTQDDSLASLELARCYKLNREYSKAVDVLGYILSAQPDNEKVHYELKDVFIRMNAVKETILFYKRFLLKFPDNNFARKFLSQAYVLAAGNLYLNNYLKESRKYYLMAQELDQNNKNTLQSSLKMVKRSLKLKNDYMRSNRDRISGVQKITDLYLADIALTEDLVLDVLSENLNNMADFCQSKNIKLFFSGYPEVTAPVMEKIALARGVELVMHQERFVRLLKDKPYLYYFVSEEDRHCTKHGYRIMAENIAAVILKNFSEQGLIGEAD